MHIHTKYEDTGTENKEVLLCTVKRDICIIKYIIIKKGNTFAALHILGM
jgi:hypothetical protein